jgi:hypothetical protein
MAKKEPEMTDREMNEFERHCWGSIKETCKLAIARCPHKKCEHCRTLKIDLDVIGDMVMAVTETEVVKGTTA